MSKNCSLGRAAHPWLGPDGAERERERERAVAEVATRRKRGALATSRMEKLGREGVVAAHTLAPIHALPRQSARPGILPTCDFTMVGGVPRSPAPRALARCGERQPVASVGVLSLAGAMLLVAAPAGGQAHWAYAGAPRAARAAFAPRAAKNGKSDAQREPSAKEPSRRPELPSSGCLSSLRRHRLSSHASHAQPPSRRR